MGLKSRVKTKSKRTPSKNHAKGFQELSVDELLKAKWNYKRDDEARAAKLAANIERNGQIESIIVRDVAPERGSRSGRYEVVNGNHRLDAFRTLDIKKAMCYNLGKISKAAAMRIAVETNETRFDSDPLILGEVIGEILSEFELPDLSATMPFDPDEMTAMAEIGDYQGTEHDDDKRGKDFENPLLGATVEVAKLMKALGIKSVSKEEAEKISEAVTRERKAQGLNLNTVKGTGLYL